MNNKGRNTKIIVVAVLAIVAAVAVYQFAFQKPCTCTLTGGGPVWSGKSPCPPAGQADNCPYPP